MAKRTVFWLTMVFVILVIDGAYAAWNLQGTLRAAADHLKAGSEAARAGEFVEAQQEFDDALAESESAVLTTNHPAPFVGRFLPVIGSDARAVRDLARAAQLTARAGQTGIEAAKEMGASTEGLAGAIFRNGVVDFEAVASGRPYMAEIDELMADAAELVSGTSEPRIGEVRTALDEARDRIPSASTTAHRASVMFGALPWLFAEDTTRKYLLIFQAPSEQRGGSGGLIGLYGILNAKNGRIELARLGSPYEEGLSPSPLPRSAVPDWYARSYSWTAALREWTSVTLSPNFPVVADILLKMYERERGEALDGVMSMDPVALAELIKATGPLQGEGMDTPITPENAVQVLAADIYTEFGNNNVAQTDYLKSVITEFWTKFSAGDAEPTTLAEAFADAARTQHFRLWAKNPEGLTPLRDLGTTGDYTLHGPNVQMVFNENIASSKVDYFLHRTIDTDIALKEDGSADVKTVVTLDNESPTGPPSLLIGPGFKTGPAGLNIMYINFLLPKNSRIDSFEINDRPIRPLKLIEEDYPIASEVVTVKAGQRREVSIDYTIPDASTITDDSGIFEMTMWPQVTVNPDEYSLKVRPPYGMRIDEGAGVNENGTLFYDTGDLGEARVLKVEYGSR